MMKNMSEVSTVTLNRRVSNTKDSHGDDAGLVGNVGPGGALAHVDHYSNQQQFTQPGKNTALSAKRGRQRSVLVCYIGPPGVF